jgi:hypothetical protein
VERDGVVGPLALEVRAVLAAEVLQCGASAAEDDARVSARDGGVVDPEDSIPVPSYDVLSLGKLDLPRGEDQSVPDLALGVASFPIPPFEPVKRFLPHRRFPPIALARDGADKRLAIRTKRLAEFRDLKAQRVVG